MRFSTWLYEQEDAIRGMKPDTQLNVYHGSTMQNIYDFCIKGIDGRQPMRRLYPHISGGKNLKFGLFVAPDAKTAFKFGNYVVEFRAVGKDLISRFPHQMKQDNEMNRSKFPDSFRPGVSDDLLNLPIEPQALFIGLVSPQQILRVYGLQNNSLSQIYSMSPEEFVKKAIEPGNRTRETEFLFSPTDYKMTLKDFASRLAQEHGDTPARIMDTLERIYRRNGYLKGIGEVPHSLLRRIERQLANYIAQRDQASI